MDVGLNYGQQREDHCRADESVAFNPVPLKSYSYYFVGLPGVLMFALVVLCLWFCVLCFTSIFYLISAGRKVRGFKNISFGN